MGPNTESQIACGTCGALTNSDRCSFCWEIESRLEAYLQRGGDSAQFFVRKHLVASLARREDPGVEAKSGKIERWLAEQAKIDLDAFVRPGIQALVKRGNITRSEIKDLRCNSWEWEEIVPKLDNGAFVERTEHALANCGRHQRPYTSYNEAVEGLYCPELLRRFKSISSTADTFAQVIDGVRQALGQERTHYFVVAGDVKGLVDAVEGCGGACELKLRELRREANE